MLQICTFFQSTGRCDFQNISQIISNIYKWAPLQHKQIGYGGQLLKD